MIVYNTRSTVQKILQMNGSVFPKAITVAGPCGIFTGIMTYLVHYLEIVPGSADSGFQILQDASAWSGFSFLVGFLIVFRTSQAYNRFWDGCTSSHKMRAEWFDGCSSIIAFTKHSEAPLERIDNFKMVLVRLFSMLHAAALATLEEANSAEENVEAFNYDILDPSGIDDISLRVIKESETKVELIFQWIQQLVVENIRTEVLSIPPPILSRCFQEVANGMVAFHDAMKISEIPFPFPYTQVCDTLLVMHWMLVPFVISQWVTQFVWAAIFGMVQVFILWSLNFIAIELENPFGMDANDLDGRAMQLEVNQHLILLIRASTCRTPVIDVTRASPLEDLEECTGNFNQAWQLMEENLQATTECGKYQRFCSRASATMCSRKTATVPLADGRATVSFRSSVTSQSSATPTESSRIQRKSTHTTNSVAESVHTSHTSPDIARLASLDSESTLSSGYDVSSQRACADSPKSPKRSGASDPHAHDHFHSLVPPPSLPSVPSSASTTRRRTDGEPKSKKCSSNELHGRPGANTEGPPFSDVLLQVHNEQASRSRYIPRESPSHHDTSSAGDRYTKMPISDQRQDPWTLGPIPDQGAGPRQTPSSASSIPDQGAGPLHDVGARQDLGPPQDRGAGPPQDRPESIFPPLLHPQGDSGGNTPSILGAQSSANNEDQGCLT